MAIYIIWLRAHIKLSRHGAYEIPNRYKGVLCLSKSIERDFGSLEQATAMSNKEFAIYRDKTLNGGKVKGDRALPVNEYSVRSGIKNSIKKWIKSEKWWCTVLSIHTIWLGVGWIVIFYIATNTRNFAATQFVLVLFWITLWTWPSMVFAMIVGNTRKSRLFFVTVWTSLGALILFPLTYLLWLMD